MEPTDLRALTWYKSSYSSNVSCVEVARTPATVAVRDSKEPDGPALLVSSAAFRRFLDGMR
jgi:hypothetical protein